MTPKTRSTNGIEIGASGPSLYDIPLYDDECMLYAITSIARKNKIPIKQIDGSKKTIGENHYSATSAYNLLKKMATSQEWYPCDVEGNPIEGETPYQYTGGEMAPSIASEIGKASGILKGMIVHFYSYDEMYAFISSVLFQNEHPNGTYIINSAAAHHATVGNGLNKKGEIKYSDYQGNGKYDSDNQKGEWTIIY